VTPRTHASIGFGGTEKTVKRISFPTLNLAMEDYPASAVRTFFEGLTTLGRVRRDQLHYRN
ncbi:MAG: hypothetical protein ABIS36_10085, partial [Chryseolinea sp.]